MCTIYNLSSFPNKAEERIWILALIKQPYTTDCPPKHTTGLSASISFEIVICSENALGYKIITNYLHFSEENQFL